MAIRAWKNPRVPPCFIVDRAQHGPAGGNQPDLGMDSTQPLLRRISIPLGPGAPIAGERIVDVGVSETVGGFLDLQDVQGEGPN